MERRHRGETLLAVLLCCAAAGGARADLMDYTATLDVQLGPTQLMQLTSSGQVDVGHGGFLLPGGIFSLSVTLQNQVTPSLIVRTTLAAFSNEAATIPGPITGMGMLSANLPFTGTLTLSLTQTSLFSNFTPQPAVMPLNVIGSVPATTFFTATSSSTTLRFSLAGAPFRTAPVFQQGRFSATSGGITTSLSLFSTRTNTGFDTRTPGGIGTLNLVSPAFLGVVLTSPFGSVTERDPATFVFTITVPQPATGLLQGGVIATLVGLGWSRLPRNRR